LLNTAALTLPKTNSVRKLLALPVADCSSISAAKFLETPKQEEVNMSKKLYVGNLSFQTTETELSETFSQHGPVENVAIITDRETGRSKGFGFVTMTEGADKAIAELGGSQLNGRTLTVNEAKPMVKKDFGGGGGGRNRRY
jgi:RNA recognition motif-containing protein